jgi:hypothetical protein
MIKSIENNDLASYKKSGSEVANIRNTLQNYLDNLNVATEIIDPKILWDMYSYNLCIPAQEDVSQEVYKQAISCINLVGYHTGIYHIKHHDEEKKPSQPIQYLLYITDAVRLHFLATTFSNNV